VFYSEFEDVGILRGVEFPLFWSGAQLQPGFTVEDNYITQGQFNGVQGVLRNDTRFRESELLSVGWNARWDLSDRWTVEADLSHSSVERLDTDLETYTGTGAGAGNGASDNIGFMVDGDGITVLDPQLDYSDPSLFLLTDPQGWGQVGFIKQPETEDELNAIRLSVQRNFDNSFIDNIVAGVNFSNREKTKDSREAFLRGFAGTTATAVPVPAEFLLEPSDFSFVGIGPVLSYDPFALFQSGFYTVEPNVNPDVITKAWQVEEEITTWYLQANIISQLGSIPVRGNAGIQIVDTDQSSQGASIGFTPNGITGVTFTEGDEYTEVLPSLNLSFELQDDLFLRTSITRTQARPRMDDLRASRQINLDNRYCGFDSGGTPFYVDFAGGSTDSCLDTSGGDPMLRPYLADAYDVSLEKYFANRTGYVSVAAFYKDISDFVFSGPGEPADFTDEITAIFGADYLAANPQAAEGFTFTPANLEGGYIQGIEFATNIPGEILFPAPFDGFGLFASYSINESEITDQNGNSFAIPGFSEDTGNVTLYYEKAGFEARISNRYRSEFLGEVTGFGANLEQRTVQEENVVDAQLGYTFQQGPLEGISVLFQAQNLTDEEFVTLTDDGSGGTTATGLVRDHQRYGTTYLIGVNWRM
jgi:iron complex outermembrane receptor protein